MNKQTHFALIVGAALLFGAAGCGKEPVAGDPCTSGEQACDSDDRVFACNDMMKWADQGYEDKNTCNCIEGRDGCAIVGYVGITTSGRPRDGGVRLRG